MNDTNIQIAVVSNSNSTTTDSSKSSASDTSFEAERSVGEECEDLASFSPTYVYSGIGEKPLVPFFGLTTWRNYELRGKDKCRQISSAHWCVKSHLNTFCLNILNRNSTGEYIVRSPLRDMQRFFSL